MFNCPETINIPNGKDFRHDRWFGINDQFAFGTLEIMREYMCLYDRIIEYLNDGSILMGEVLVKHCLDKNKIPLRRFDFNFGIKRV